MLILYLNITLILLCVEIIAFNWRT